MANIAELNLDIKKKNDLQENKTIILRQGDNTDTIKVYILLNGLPYTDIKSATFFAEKPDSKIIANDPANIEDTNIISYPIPEQLTAAQGNITEAYFMINGTSTTDSFRILILKGVNLTDASGNYIPGLSQLNEEIEKANADTIKKVNDLRAGVNNIDVDSELHTIIGNAIDSAKEKYVTDYNKSAKELNDLINSANTNKDELSKKITELQNISKDSDSLLADVRKKILDDNATFTADQKKIVDDQMTALAETIATTQKSADSLKDEVTTIKKSVDDVNIPKINADTSTALENSKSALETANDAATMSQNTDKKIGDLPSNSTVVEEINNSQKVTGATLNGTVVPIEDKQLVIKVPEPDLKDYATNDSVDETLKNYPKTTDVNEQLKPYLKTSDADDNYLKKNDAPKNVLIQWQGTDEQFNNVGTKLNNTEYTVLNVDGSIKNIYVGNEKIFNETISPGTLLGKTSYKFDSSVGYFVDKDGTKASSSKFSFDKTIDPNELENGICFMIADVLSKNKSSSIPVAGLLANFGFDITPNEFLSANGISHTGFSVLNVNITKQQLVNSNIFPYPSEDGILVPLTPIFIPSDNTSNDLNVRGINQNGGINYLVSMSGNECFFPTNMTIFLDQSTGKPKITSASFNLTTKLISFKNDQSNMQVDPGIKILAAVAY